MRKMIARIGAIVYIAAIVVITVLFTIRDANDILVREVVIEAGSDVRKMPDSLRIYQESTQKFLPCTSLRFFTAKLLRRMLY